MKFFLDQTENYQELIDSYQIEGVFLSEADPSLKSTQYIIKDDEIYEKETKIGRRLVINSPETMQDALNQDIEEELKIILIETSDWHIIPLENLIAKFATRSTQLIASASTPEEITLLANILELGVDGCLLHGSDIYSAKDLLDTLTAEGDNLSLQEVKVKSVKRIGNGDRVCVDTVSILKEGEGMLVGSTAAVQVLVQAEVEETGFVNSRPFRINAGVVASYCLNFTKTNYLSELAAGSSVMIVDRQGRTRKEFVARVKIERRPLLVLKVLHQEREFPIILQDAETVKIVTTEGSKRVDALQEGDTILGYVSEKARHFGMEIHEFLEEK